MDSLRSDSPGSLGRAGQDHRHQSRAKEAESVPGVGFQTLSQGWYGGQYGRRQRENQRSGK